MSDDEIRLKVLRILMRHPEGVDCVTLYERVTGRPVPPKDRKVLEGKVAVLTRTGRQYASAMN